MHYASFLKNNNFVVTKNGSKKNYAYSKVCIQPGCLHCRVTVVTSHLPKNAREGILSDVEVCLWIELHSFLAPPHLPSPSTPPYVMWAGGELFHEWFLHDKDVLMSQGALWWQCETMGPLNREWWCHLLPADSCRSVALPGCCWGKSKASDTHVLLVHEFNHTPACVLYCTPVHQSTHCPETCKHSYPHSWRFWTMHPNIYLGSPCVIIHCMAVQQSVQSQIAEKWPPHSWKTSRQTWLFVSGCWFFG
jgi:hypothetical protein